MGELIWGHYHLLQALVCELEENQVCGAIRQPLHQCVTKRYATYLDRDVNY